MIYELKSFRDRRTDLPVSIYVLNSNRLEWGLEKVSCLFCKRTIYDMNGTIDRIVIAPIPILDFGVAINIQCKQCKQAYRLLLNPN